VVYNEPFRHNTLVANAVDIIVASTRATCGEQKPVSHELVVRMDDKLPDLDGQLQRAVVSKQ